MEWKIEYWPDTEIVYVATQGEMTLDSLKRMAAETIAEAVARSSVKLLADHRATIHALAVTEIFRLPEMLREVGLTPNYRVATLFSVSGGQRPDFKFFDDRAYNTGLQHALFTDLEAARTWLAT